MRRPGKLFLLFGTIPLYVFITLRFDLVQGAFSYYFSLAFAAIVFLFAARIFIRDDQVRLRATKNIALIGSLCLMAYAALGLVFSLPLNRVVLAISLIGYCFFYGPLEMVYKIRRWTNFTTSKSEIIGLSIIDFLGVNLILLGLINRFLYWPGYQVLIYTGGAVLIVGVVFWNRKFKMHIIEHKQNQDQIQRQYQIIREEKHRSEQLLLNILPADIAEELKSTGRAEARCYEKVSILFTDFQGFTQTTATMSAQAMVAEINTCFKAFDQIVEKHQIEKIKTIGDAYMAAGGLIVSTPDACKNTVLAALDMQDFISRRKAGNTAAGNPAFSMRVGIHTGMVVAGIVGSTKFQYDLWGDSVNTAARIESAGTIGRVNISETTYALIKDDPGFCFEDRGLVAAKGKGKLKMYFVEPKLVDL